MSSASAAKEGTVAVPGGKVWYRVVGAGLERTPLVLLHGGPGSGHDAFEPLAALADQRPVVFYDQLGCGRSEIPDDASLWRVERFVAELAELRRALGLGRMHLLGSSWGGWLAIEYAIAAGDGLAGLVLSSTSASAQQFLRGARELLAQMGPRIRDTVERCEREGRTDDPEYLAASLAFYREHLCRLDPWPEAMVRSARNVAMSATYAPMWGASEFSCTGALKDWDRSADLGAITVPTLVTRGAHDEMVQACADTLVAGIRNSELHVFEHSSHTAQLEEPERCCEVVRAFLQHNDA